MPIVDPNAQAEALAAVWKPLGLFCSWKQSKISPSIYLTVTSRTTGRTVRLRLSNHRRPGPKPDLFADICTPNTLRRIQKDLPSILNGPREPNQV